MQYVHRIKSSVFARSINESATSHCDTVQRNGCRLNFERPFIDSKTSAACYADTYFDGFYKQSNELVVTISCHR